MRSSTLLTWIFLLFFSFCAETIFSQDTLIVQTFTWDSDNRRDTFQFPDDPNLTFRKIWMRYNMRCHDVAVGNGNVGCREWDYSCNTFITDPSRKDSIQRTHPNFVVSSFSGTSFPYTSQPTYTYFQYEQHQASLSGLITSETMVGAGVLPLTLFENAQVAKGQFLFRADELNGAGLSAGNIFGMHLDVLETGAPIGFLRIRLKATSNMELEAQNPDLEDFTEVYFSNTEFINIGLQELAFYTPFDWDGTSNILMEFSYTTPTANSGNIIKSHEAGFNAGLTSKAADPALHFQGVGTVEVPAEAMASSISNEITISLWANGIPEIMPANSTIFEGMDANGNRQANVHLPWSNGQVYWDCGNDDSSYDRINKQANEVDYEGGWNHWAFTKNATTGEMRIYLNGVLWHSGTGLFKPILIENFNIGTNANGGSPYFGSIDEFRVWNKALDEATIQHWMLKSVDNTHPNYDALVHYFPMNEGAGNQLQDASPNAINATIYLPNWSQTRGRDLFKNFEISTLRPNVIFLQGDYTITEEVVLALDSVENSLHSIIEYEIMGESVAPIDTFWTYPAGGMNVLDEMGNVVDTILVIPESTLDIETLVYHTTSDSKLELISLVTPYGNGLDLGPDGKTFTFDVTDFAPVLKGEKVINIQQGGQWQEELDIRFYFITGTPPRDVQNIQNIWPFRSSGYGALQNDSHFEPRQVPLSPNGDAYKIRSSVTGHGSNGEFVPRQHYININGGVQDFTYDVWKECADNPIYPQGGTWIFDRAGWCPGAATDVHEFWLNEVAQPGDIVEVDYGVNGANLTSANYLVSNQLVTYGAFNFNTDAALERIARPSSGQVEFERINPACAMPIIWVKNTGAETITSLKIGYEVVGNDEPLIYDWTGNLPSLETAEIALPVEFVSFWSTTANKYQFEANILEVNGSPDENSDNDAAAIPFELATIFDFGDDLIELETNTNNSGFENSYIITDAMGNIVLERDDMPANTDYKDAVDLPAGCYTLHFSDSGHDGLEFWFFPENGIGNLRFRRTLSPTISIPVESFDPDFGSGVQFDFVIPLTLNTQDLEEPRIISIYPNPTFGEVQVELQGFDNQEIEIEVMDLTGRILISKKVETNRARQHSLDLTNLVSGMYFLKVRSGIRVWSSEVVKF